MLCCGSSRSGRHSPRAVQGSGAGAERLQRQCGSGGGNHTARCLTLVLLLLLLLHLLLLAKLALAYLFLILLAKHDPEWMREEVCDAKGGGRWAVTGSGGRGQHKALKFQLTKHDSDVQVKLSGLPGVLHRAQSSDMRACFSSAHPSTPAAPP